MRSVFKIVHGLALALVLSLIASSEAFAQATITILNGDAAGVGFNDTTPATPVGGNSGTTIGQQRLIAVQHAAGIWGATLVSGPTIVIRATWVDMASTGACTATSGTLASAGNSGNIWRDFAGAVPGFWYGNALANAISGVDRNDQANGTPTHEINTQFNRSLGTPGCLENSHWYYGLDTNHGPGGINLVSVTLHEFGHGLGFQTFTNKETGEQAFGFPTIYDRFLFDSTQNKTWPQLTNAERVASAINTGNLVWVGPEVLADAPNVLAGTPRLRVNSPGVIAGIYPVGTASFGPLPSSAGTTGDVVQALDAADGAGPTTTDGCSTLTNAAAVSGKIALIDRGTCTFVQKVKNAQNAGAAAVIIVDNQSNPPTPPAMGGTDSAITITAVSITMADGSSIKGQLGGGVNATILSDTTVLAGTDANRRPLMFAPSTLQSGSSVSHWDSSLLPNQVMEPSIQSDLLHLVTPPRDLTFSLLKDIGWTGPLMIFVEQGTAAAAALDSVTHVRGPFNNLSPNNLNPNDRRTRLIFFTSYLGPNPGDDLSAISVRANGIPLVVEAAGQNSPIGSYVVVRLEGLPQNTYLLSITYRGVNGTNTPSITIMP